RQRRGGPHRRPDPPGQPAALHQHLAAGGVSRPGDRGQRGGRPAVLPERSSRGRAGVRRADRTAGLAVPASSRVGGAGHGARAADPFPTRPAPFAKQGFTLDDANDLTPEVQRLARKKLQRLRLGPLFTPPSLEGTVAMPGIIGGAGWGGGALDPETGIFYVKA